MPILSTSPSLAGRWRVDPHTSHARFVARTLGGLVTTPGRFRSLSGNLAVDEARAAGVLVIDSASIDTGNRLRDRHLRSRAFFGVKRHPQLSYDVDSIVRPAPGIARIDGDLVVAGTRTPLPLDVTLREPAHGVVELVCHTQVDRVALGIRGSRGMVPRAVGVDVAITLRRALG
jgi:polyisoprenoid-binding protein YceI